MKVRNISLEKQQIEDLYVTLQPGEAINLTDLFPRPKLDRSKKLTDLLRKGLLVEYQDIVPVMDRGSVVMVPNEEPKHLLEQLEKSEVGILSKAVEESKKNVVHLKSEKGNPQISIKMPEEPKEEKPIEEPLTEAKLVGGSVMVDYKKEKPQEVSKPKRTLRVSKKVEKEE